MFYLWDKVGIINHPQGSTNPNMAGELCQGLAAPTQIWQEYSILGLDQTLVEQ